MVEGEYCLHKCSDCPLSRMPVERGNLVRIAVNTALIELGGPDEVRRMLKTNSDSEMGEVYTKAFDSLPRSVTSRTEASDAAFIAIEKIAFGICEEVRQTTS